MSKTTKFSIVHIIFLCLGVTSCFLALLHILSCLYVFSWVFVIIASVLSIFGGTCCVLSKIFYDKMIESIFPSEEKISKMIEEIAESYCQSKLESKKKEELFKKLNKQLDEFENYVNGQSK